VGGRGGVTPRKARGRPAGSVTVELPTNHEVTSVEYQLRLIKVGGETRWAVHDGRKVVGKLFETYGQAAADRTRLERLEPPRPGASTG
jgi:hypothetical protein